MFKFIIKIADLRFLIQCHYQFCFDLCKDYIVGGNEYDIEIVVNDEDLDKEKDLLLGFDIGYIESLTVYRMIAEKIPFFHRFLMHGAVITFQDNGYMFTAPSGTGKSTHIRLWRKFLGENVDIVNGDKPILWANDAGVYVFGTPWCGKEGWQKNRNALLNGVCFIEQGRLNRIKKINNDECLSLLMKQVYMSKDFLVMGNILDCLDLLMRHVPFYLLECDMSMDAVRCSFEALTGLVFDDWRVCDED